MKLYTSLLPVIVTVLVLLQCGSETNAEPITDLVFSLLSPIAPTQQASYQQLSAIKELFLSPSPPAMEPECDDPPSPVMYPSPPVVNQVVEPECYDPPVVDTPPMVNPSPPVVNPSYSGTSSYSNIKNKLSKYKYNPSAVPNNPPMVDTPSPVVYPQPIMVDPAVEPECYEPPMVEPPPPAIDYIPYPRPSVYPQPPMVDPECYEPPMVDTPPVYPPSPVVDPPPSIYPQPPMVDPAVEPECYDPPVVDTPPVVNPSPPVGSLYSGTGGYLDMKNKFSKYKYNPSAMATNPKSY